MRIRKEILEKGTRIESVGKGFMVNRGGEMEHSESVCERRSGGGDSGAVKSGRK